MPMPTDRLYYDNAYLTAFDAVVLACRDGWAALDRSAFYPTSGGQPFDTGTLTVLGRDYAVTDVQVQDNVVWHRIDASLPEGTPVHGRIDWPRRFDHMQQHAGDHMLAGAAWQLFGATTIGLHVGNDVSSIDLSFPDGRTRLADEEIDRWEMLVNERVQQDDPIRCWFPEPDELADLPLRKPPTVREHVRIVAMGDYEMVACGGTHPRTTGQIGPVKILSCAPSRGNMRLTFVSGMRATKYMARACRCAHSVAAALSSDLDSALPALEREREASQSERRALQTQLTEAALQMLQSAAQSLPSGTLYTGYFPFLSPIQLQSAAAQLLRQDENALALLSCPGKSGRTLIFCRGSALPYDMAALLSLSGARGGGKPDFAQGSAPDDTPLKNAIAQIINKEE